MRITDQHDKGSALVLIRSPERRPLLGFFGHVSAELETEGVTGRAPGVGDRAYLGHDLVQPGRVARPGGPPTLPSQRVGHRLLDVRISHNLGHFQTPPCCQRTLRTDYPTIITWACRGCSCKNRLCH